MHDYLGCVKAVDDSVGRLLKYLDDEGLAENTIVVYSSDQGFYLGEHGWFDKRWIFEESLRTPLLVRWPGVDQGRDRPAPGSSRISTSPRPSSKPPALPIPADMQGRSLVPLLKGETRPTGGSRSTTSTTSTPSRTTSARITASSPTATSSSTSTRPDVDYWELFDLKTDPQELRNAIDDPANAEVVADLKAELARLRAELKVPSQTPPEASGRSTRPAAKGGCEPSPLI